MSNFHFDLSLKLSQGEVHDFSGEMQKFPGEVQNDRRGGAHLATPHLPSKSGHGNSYEQCNYRPSSWEKSNLRPCDSGAALYNQLSYRETVVELELRPDFGGNSGGGGKRIRGGAASGLAHDPHGKLGLRTDQIKVNDVTYACRVHMHVHQCINES